MRMLFRALKSLERAQEGLYNKIVPEPNLLSYAPRTGRAAGLTLPTRYLKNAKMTTDEEAYDASLRFEPRK